jgi:hypothetical protein
MTEGKKKRGRKKKVSIMVQDEPYECQAVEAHEAELDLSIDSEPEQPENNVRDDGQNLRKFDKFQNTK